MDYSVKKNTWVTEIGPSFLSVVVNSARTMKYREMNGLSFYFVQGNRAVSSYLLSRMA